MTKSVLEIRIDDVLKESLANRNTQKGVSQIDFVEKSSWGCVGRCAENGSPYQKYS